MHPRTSSTAPGLSLIAAMVLVGCTLDGDSTTVQNQLGPACDYGPIPMVRATAGTFSMGSPETEIGRKENEVLHEVTLTGDFCVATTEFTVAQYRETMGADPPGEQVCGDDCPVVQLSWDDAAALANALSDRLDLAHCYTCEEGACSAAQEPLTCPGFRLPTEAEWEYAARAGVQAPFPNGESLTEGEHAYCKGRIEDQDPLGMPDDIGWYCEDGYTAVLHPVAQLSPNAWGLYDVVGNAWEWCHDRYAWEMSDAAATDPTGPTEGDKRSVRGGSFEYYPRYVRPAHRAGGPPDTRYRDLGVRLVRSVGPR